MVPNSVPLSSSSSWVPVPPDSDFSLHNLPFGVFSVLQSDGGNNAAVTRRRCATILGDTVIDLGLLEEADLLLPTTTNLFQHPTLNAFLEQPRAVWVRVRHRLQQLLGAADDGDDALRSNANLQAAAFHHVSTVQLHLPMTIGDYTDFYSSREHATNGTRALLPPLSREL
jgi:fumarylacetoacetase